MKSKDFFYFCENNNLITYGDISEAFCVSSQTIRNWKKRDYVPSWVFLSTFYVSSSEHFSKFDFDSFKRWQRKHNLKTYEDTANIFGVKRQAVHQWFRRGKFPTWLGIACWGYDLKMKNNL